MISQSCRTLINCSKWFEFSPRRSTILRPSGFAWHSHAETRHSLPPPSHFVMMAAAKGTRMEEHHATIYFREILIILAIAGILVPVLHRFKLSPVLSYLIAGMVIGPYGLGLLTDDIPFVSTLAITDLEWVRSVAEFGVMLLLFMIGLELSISRLWDMRRLVLGFGSAQILVSAAVISVIAFIFDNPVETSILMGACLALSSTAIVIQLLREQHRFSTPVGTTGFSVLLMQDLAVVPILILVTIFANSDGTSIVSNISEAMIKAVIVITVIYIAGRKLLRPLFKYLGFSHNAEWFMAVTLFIVIGSAALTYTAGLSMALGAFLAGLMLCETEYRHEIEMVIDPLKGVFLGIFFLSVGMVIDLREIANEPFWLIVSVAGLFAIKTSIIFILGLLFRMPWIRALEVGLLLGQSGEFAFMIVSMAMAEGLISVPHGQFFMIVSACSMLATPLVSVLAMRLSRVLENRYGSTAGKPSIVIPENEEKGHIIIAGFGRVGRLLGEVLEREQIAYLAMDNNSPRVATWRDKGLSVFYGDARRADLWRKLDIEHARAVLLTVDQPESAEAILKTLRKHWPNCMVIARARDGESVQSLYEHGATLVVQETLEASLQLARFVLEKLQVDECEIDSVITRSREAAV